VPVPIKAVLLEQTSRVVSEVIILAINTFELMEAGLSLLCLKSSVVSANSSDRN